MLLKKLFNQCSYKVQILIGTISISLLCSLILFGFYYANVYKFYKEKIETNQINELELIKERLNNITEQVVQTSNSTIGSFVSEGQFVDYHSKTPYEKLQLRRKISSQLTNMILTYDKIQNIYCMSFDDEVFTSSRDIDNNAFTDSIELKPDLNQEGMIQIIPTHEAVYYQYQKLKQKYPYVLSYQAYLNKYTPGNTIGLVQIDINYDTIQKSVFAEEMTDTDFVVILDQNNRVIFSPDESMLGKEILDSDSEIHYGNVLQSIGKGKVYISRNVTIRYEEEDFFHWKILQINSDAMFKSAMRNTRVICIAIAITCLLCAYSLSFILSKNINRSILSIVDSMLEASNGNFEIDIKGMEHNEFSQLADKFNDMIVKIDVLMKENVSKERERTMMEVAALNSKINNHFLYNTLNLIKLLAIKNKQTSIAKIIVSLSNILEYSYNDTDTLVSLNKEIEFTKNYIYIQTARFNKQVEVLYNVEPALKQINVPKMILQPIVENSILHGFLEGENNQIVISVQRIYNKIQIRIADNGCGFIYEGLNQLTGIGLKNVIQRMNIFYEPGFYYEIESKLGQGTIVIFEIAYEKENK